MDTTFTSYNQKSTYLFNSLDDIDDAANFFKGSDSFRSFQEGLTELMVKKGYMGNTDDVEALSEYLMARLKKINSQISKKVVMSWFSGEHAPKTEAGSRSKIYEICFALELSYEGAVWFFQHVYYDRAFNCHTIDEAVYCYAFRNRLTYSEAQKMIHEIESAPDADDTVDVSGNYTQFVKERIFEFASVSELKAFLIQNKGNFNTWNKSALDTLNSLVSQLIGPPESKTAIDNLKRTIIQKQNSNANIRSLDLRTLIDYESCGLLMKELLFDSVNASIEGSYESPADYFLQAVGELNFQKNTFILDRILNTVEGLNKNDEVPYIVRHNFPSKKIMSDVLSENKISASKSYDSIRKMIVLLDFYRFWANIKIRTNPDYVLGDKKLCEIYIEEANALLYHCGYEDLYVGNPYDWIFFSSARSQNPLEYFRGFMATIDEDRPISHI